MLRTIISLPSELKNWLDNYSHINNKTTAETIREAIREYKNKIENNSKDSILQKTSGLWADKNKDAIDYVDSIRSEWN